VEKAIASKIIESVVALNKKIGDVDLVISEMANGKEKDHYIAALGHVIGILSKDIILPITQKYPDLEPYN